MVTDPKHHLGDDSDGYGPINFNHQELESRIIVLASICQGSILDTYC